MWVPNQGAHEGRPYQRTAVELKSIPVLIYEVSIGMTSPQGKKKKRFAEADLAPSPKFGPDGGEGLIKLSGS